MTVALGKFLARSSVAAAAASSRRPRDQENLRLYVLHGTAHYPDTSRRMAVATAATANAAA
jgi:hypothetical protein